MKNVAFITSGFFPVPATKGGAVESLVQNLIDENEKQNKKKFTIFSIYEKEAEKKSHNYNNTEFLFYKPFILIKIMDYILYYILTFILKKEKKTSYKFIVQRLFYLNYVSKMLKKSNYSCIVIENNTTLFLALKWRKNYIKYKDKYYFHLHNDINNFYGCKKIIEGCNKIFTVSKYISNIVEKKLIYNPNKIHILMNCIDINRFNSSYSKKEKTTLRKSLNISEKDKVIIFVGRTIKEKGILELIRAFNNSKNKNWKLLLVGSSGFDINVKSDFEKELYLETEKNNNIIFTGFISYSDLGLYYSIADLAVLPSIWEEPAGLTMLEAVSSSIPLITTNSGGIPEYVKKYKTIILEKNEKIIENILENMENVLEKGELANKNYSSECHKDFNLDVYLNNFIRLLDLR